jgi:hypothetical protein
MGILGDGLKEAPSLCRAVVMRIVVRDVGVNRGDTRLFNRLEKRRVTT